MNEYDIYAKLPNKTLYLEASGVLAVSAYAAVQGYLRDSDKYETDASGRRFLPMLKYTAQRARITS